MTRKPFFSTSPVPPMRSGPRRELPFSIALGVPLLLLVACGSGQTISGTGGAAGSTTAGTGGMGSGGSGAVGGKGSGGSGGVGPGGNSGSGGKGGKSGAGGKGGSSSGAGGGGGAGAGSGGAGGGSGGSGGVAGGGGAGGAGAGGAGGGSSCAGATSGATCDSEGATCGGPCTDICQFCNLLRCTGGHWQAMEAFPAPCFTCGDGKCQTMNQYCRTTEGGPSGSTPGHSCIAIPTECLSTRTCACFAQNAVPGTCTMGSNGELMTLVQVP